MRLPLTIVLLVLSACASSQARNAAGAVQRRFPSWDEVAILPPPGAPHPTLLESSAHFAVRGPRPAGGPDRLAVVYIIDTLGRVEVPSASFVIAPRQTGLRTMVCNYLRGAHYTRPGRRTMLMGSWAFDTGQVPSPPAMFLVDTIADRLREMPRDSLFLDLARRQHCN